MRLKSFCVYFVVLVLAAEPCLPSVPVQASKPKRAALCGMKTDCGMPCCRVFDNKTISLCVMSKVLGLYSSNCWPGHTPSSLFAPSAAKWIPTLVGFLPPAGNVARDFVQFSFTPFQPDPLSPPPRA